MGDFPYKCDPIFPVKNSLHIRLFVFGPSPLGIFCVGRWLKVFGATSDAFHPSSLLTLLLLLLITTIEEAGTKKDDRDDDANQQEDSFLLRESLQRRFGVE